MMPSEILCGPGTPSSTYFTERPTEQRAMFISDFAKAQMLGANLFERATPQALYIEIKRQLCAFCADCIVHESRCWSLLECKMSARLLRHERFVVMTQSHWEDDGFVLLCLKLSLHFDTPIVSTQHAQPLQHLLHNRVFKLECVSFSLCLLKMHVYVFKRLPARSCMLISSRKKRN